MPHSFTSYLAMGDSVTQGVGDPVGDMPLRSWADLVADALRILEPALRYENVARGGATTAAVLSEQVPVLEAMRPEFVSITIGGNDARHPRWSPETFEAEYAALLEAVAGVGAQVMTAAYPDIRPALEAAGQHIPDKWTLYFERMHLVDEIIRSVGGRFDAWLVDLEHHPVSRDPSALSSDFVHPNARGYAVTARVALGVLADRLGQPALADAVPPLD